MPDYWLTVPFAQSIADPAHWTRLDPKLPAFHIIRLGFFCRDVGRPSSLTNGEILQDLSTAAGTTREYHEVRKASYTFLSARKTVRQIVERDESLNEFVASLGGPGSPMRLKSRVGDVTTVTTATRLEQAATHTAELVAEEKVTIEPNSEVVAVALYEPRTYELHLQFIDELSITYERPGVFRRKRRVKSPTSVDGNLHWRYLHPNIYNYPRPGVPWAQVTYWRQHRSSFGIVERRDYKNDLPRPFEVKVEPLNRSLRHAPGDPGKDEIRSLYRLANDAFPYRRPPKGLNKKRADDTDDR